MAETAEQRLDTLEGRVDSLEVLLGHFIVSTNAALIRMERGIAQLKDEMIASKEENEKEHKRMNKRWGELANKMGTVVEDIVAPNIPRMGRTYFSMEELELFAIRLRKRSSKDRSLRRDFDVIAVSDDAFLVNETKSTPTVEYINDFVALLAEIDDYFPEYKGRKLIPVFSSLAISDNILSYLTKRGIYGMSMKDDTMDLLNFDAVGHGSEQA